MELLSQYTSNSSSERPDSSDKDSETAKVRSVYQLMQMPFVKQF